MTCDLCARNSGIYDLTRTCCSLRLINSAPAGLPRKAMAAHVKRSVPAELWEALCASTSAQTSGGSPTG